MKAWLAKGIELLKTTLGDPKHELNELDWKAAISPNNKRLAEHLSAFSNYPGGGYLVYGVLSDGTLKSVEEKEVGEILNNLANIGRYAVEPPIALDHAISTYDSKGILFVFVAESPVKPVHKATLPSSVGAKSL